VNLGNRTTREPAQDLIDFDDPAGQNFRRPFFVSLKDMAQSINDLGFDLFFRDCVHVCHDSL
jgi:hypothetical protein